jgi:Protein of unknown function, DUF547
LKFKHLQRICLDMTHATLDFTLVSRRHVLASTAFLLASASLPTSVFAAEPLSKFAPDGSGTFNHSAFDTILGGAVKPDAEGYNRVDYRALKGSQSALQAYLADLQAAQPSAMSKAEAKAYWINLYNAKTLDVILERYPVSSIKKINLGGGGIFGSGPWSAKLMTIEGQEISLDDIEHRILLAVFKDPMTHYALNCASYSCPNLATRAFKSKNTAALMRENAVAYVNHPRGVTVADGSITASKIYSWYAGDFGGKRQLKPHWLKFAEPAKGEQISAAQGITFDYDWRLNDV